jgi:hypothetical protein
MMLKIGRYTASSIMATRSPIKMMITGSMRETKVSTFVWILWS